MFIRDSDQTGSTVIDFVAVGGTVLGAIVKGGPVANFYDYRPGGVLLGTSLHPPVNEQNKKLPFYGLSHVDFCYGKPTTPTPTPTPTETPSVTPSETPSETPSDTPSESPSETPSDTPSESPSVTPSDTPSESPSETPSETPTVSPTHSPSESTPPVAVPTEVDAGLSGTANKSAITSTQGIWGGVLLAFGGILLVAGLLKSRQRRGHHAA
jgi:outer membrane biosynthesis protein TonB